MANAYDFKEVERVTLVFDNQALNGFIGETVESSCVVKNNGTVRANFLESVRMRILNIIAENSDIGSDHALIHRWVHNLAFSVTTGNQRNTIRNVADMEISLKDTIDRREHRLVLTVETRGQPCPAKLSAHGHQGTPTRPDTVSFATRVDPSGQMTPLNDVRVDLNGIHNFSGGPPDTSSTRATTSNLRSAFARRAVSPINGSNSSLTLDDIGNFLRDSMEKEKEQLYQAYWKHLTSKHNAEKRILVASERTNVVRYVRDHMDEDEVKKFDKAATKWMSSCKEDATKAADSHSILAVVGALIFSVAATAFRAVTGDWYDDKDDTFWWYSVSMALACMLSAMGVATAIFRSWTLKRLAVVGPTQLAEFTTKNSGWFIVIVNGTIWGAVFLFLGGMAALARLVLEWPASIIILGIFLAGVGFALSALIVLTLGYMGAYAEARRQNVSPPRPDDYWLRDSTQNRKDVLSWGAMGVILVIGGLVVYIAVYFADN